ncbi:NAD(P)-dependent oxidoreductase [Plastorhodobacter daqingensis]|uniref:NAD(P)-dependent oxidoreductase n=1 Tax=Plastorhodobacter daqingensis TaxID=1387281 RepID=A0ABW2UPZ3_9RHOB
MRLFILGASGGVGQRLTEQALARGHDVTAQTRTAANITVVQGVSVAVGRPDDEIFLKKSMAGHDAVIVCLGLDRTSKTTLFSDSTRAVIAAMQQTGIRRLIVVTGVGAGETKGHGGWFYNRIIFPLFTRNRYADKDIQEAMIERSDLDWTILRPAPFKAQAGQGEWTVVTQVPPGLQLKSVTRDEVASFILDCVEGHRFLHQKPFFGRS